MALKNAKGHLIKSIDATSMSSNLFKAGLISQRQYEECKGEKSEKVEKVVEYLLKAVSMDPKKFYAFLHILHRTEDFAIAGQLRGQFIRVHLSVQSIFYPVRVRMRSRVMRLVASVCVCMYNVYMYVYVTKITLFSALLFEKILLSVLCYFLS